MSCKANSSSKPIKFQPMPMAALIANLKALPATLNQCESSDSSNDSISPLDETAKKPVPARAQKRTPIPRNATSVSNKENKVRESRYFDRVHIMPTIDDTSNSQAIVDLTIPKRPPLVEKKDSARCLFPEEDKDPPLKLKEAPKPTSSKYVIEPKGGPHKDVSSSKDSIIDLTTPKHILNKCAISDPGAPKSVSSKTYDISDPCPPKPLSSNTHAISNPGAPKGLSLNTYAISNVGPSKPSSSKTVSHHNPSVPATPTQAQDKNPKIHFKTVSVNGKIYMVSKQLGTGGSSEVFKVLEFNTGNEYALKCVNLSTDRELAKGYINEVRVLRELQESDRVVKLYEYEFNKSESCLRILLEAGETDLACFLRAHKDGLPPALVVYYWEEMLQAVLQIHKHGIVHTDLKPANFLLVSGTLKLIDFGIASAVSSDATSVVRTRGQGTISYISPEALGGERNLHMKVSFYSDVWSLGCILYSLVYGRTPFDHLKSLAKMYTIRDPNHYISYPHAENIPPSLMAALKQCLRYDGHHRPTVTELLQINYMSQNMQSIPDAILNKIKPHVTPREFSILENAKVTAAELKS